MAKFFKIFILLLTLLFFICGCGKNDSDNIYVPKNPAVEAEIIADGYDFIGTYQYDTVIFYSKTINGIRTDDFKIVYYFSNGSYKISESNYKLNTEDVANALEKYAEFEIKKMISQNTVT